MNVDNYLENFQQFARFFKGEVVGSIPSGTSVL